MQKIKAKPFLKWAGGKGQLISQFQEYYPKDLYSQKIDKYIEPFIGGGAIFFDIMQNFKINSAYISDVNKDLILTYKVIQNKPEILCDFLEQYQKDYDKTIQEDRNNLFLSVRKHFNTQRFEINYKQFSDNWIPRAAQLIFLNKTCFNGLYRLNSKGEFNVPYGKYLNPTILDNENIFAVSKLLQNVEIRNANYSECYNETTSNSFVYFDPPYKPISKTASFTTYTGTEFTDKEQIDLANFYRKLDTEKQAKLMLSNSDPKNENPLDDFFETVFKDYNLHKVNASRAINCNGQKRGKIKELVITNYKYEPRTLAINF
jgi:DNA adenine methylase